MPPTGAGTLVKLTRRAGVQSRIPLERQVVRQVRACAGKPVSLGSSGDPVRQGHRIAAASGVDFLDEPLEAALHLDNCPGKRGRIAAVENDGIEAVQAQMLVP